MLRNQNEAYISMPKLSHRWDVCRKHLDYLLRRHNVSSIMIGSRRKCRMSDVLRAENEMSDLPSPARGRINNMRRSRRAGDDARAAA